MTTRRNFFTQLFGAAAGVVAAKCGLGASAPVAPSVLRDTPLYLLSSNGVCRWKTISELRRENLLKLGDEIELLAWSGEKP